MLGIREQIQTVFKRDPAARSVLEIVLCYPGFHAVTLHRIAHGLYTASLISAVIGTRLPGPGAVYLSQTLNFKAPVRIGDTVVAAVEVAELIAERLRVKLLCTCRVEDRVVLEGDALVKVPRRP